MSMTRCLGCQALLARGSRCQGCQQRHELTRRPSSAQRYGPGWSKISKAQIIAEPYCNYCGTPGDPDNPLTTDHTKPVSIYGPNTDDLVTACRRCNSALQNHQYSGTQHRR
jgi:5-methylcytosine-specific restriction endonuclease McrA